MKFKKESEHVFLSSSASGEEFNPLDNAKYAYLGSDKDVLISASSACNVILTFWSHRYL